MEDRFHNPPLAETEVSEKTRDYCQKAWELGLLYPGTEQGLKNTWNRRGFFAPDDLKIVH